MCLHVAGRLLKSNVLVRYYFSRGGFKNLADWGLGEFDHRPGYYEFLKRICSVIVSVILIDLTRLRVLTLQWWKVAHYEVERQIKLMQASPNETVSSLHIALVFVSQEDTFLLLAKRRANHQVFLATLNDCQPLDKKLLTILMLHWYMKWKMTEIHDKKATSHVEGKIYLEIIYSYEWKVKDSRIRVACKNSDRFQSSWKETSLSFFFR